MTVEKTTKRKEKAQNPVTTDLFLMMKEELEMVTESRWGTLRETMIYLWTKIILMTIK